MKIKAIIASLGLTLTATGALTAGLVSSKNNSVKQTKATIVASGNTFISLAQTDDNNDWVKVAAKFAIYYWDNNSDNNGWSEFATATEDSKTYVAHYALDFQPTDMKLVRINPSAEAPSWSADWGQSGNQGFHDAICYKAQESATWSDNFSSTSGLSSDFVLDNFKESSTNGWHNESYKKAVSFAENDTFKIEDDSVEYGSFSLDSAISGAFVADNGSIKCVIPGSYDIYFNHTSHSLWIQANADSAAENYASYFMTAFTCDDGESEPSFKEGITWSSLSSKYTAEITTEGARAKFANADPEQDRDIFDRMIARYKAVITHWGTTKYSDFIGRGYKAPNESNTMKSVSQNNSVAIIVASTSVVAISLVAAFLLLKKRKEN